MTIDANTGEILAPVSAANFSQRCCSGSVFHFLDDDCNRWHDANPNYFMGSGWTKCGAFDPSLSPPVLRSAGEPPEVDANGLAPSGYGVDDVVDAAREQTKRELDSFWANVGYIGGSAPKPETDYTPLALLVGGLALFLVVRH